MGARQTVEGEGSTTRAALKAAFPVTLPVMAGYVFIGITYGILCFTSGLPLWYPVLTAAIIYTGSLEFLSVSIMLGSFHPVSAFVTAFVVGARHLFYGLAMLDKYRGTGKKKIYLIYTTSDETFAVNYGAKIPLGVDRSWFYFWVSLLDQCYWVTGTFLGSLCGTFITFSTEGLDFVMTAMFISIFMGQWLKDGKAGKKEKEKAETEKKEKSQGQKTAAFLRHHAGSLIGVAASVLCLLVFGPDNFIIPSMICILVVLLVLRPVLDDSLQEREKSPLMAADEIRRKENTSKAAKEKDPEEKSI